MQVAVRNSYDPPCFASPDVAVFFDVIRASTTLLSLVHVGASRIYSANDEETCRSFHQQGYELISEVFAGGIDNSPSQVLAGSFGGRAVIHKSTNLTAAVFHNRSCHRALIGGFANATTLAAHLAKTGAETVELIAASHFGKRTEAVEDISGALTVAAMIRGEFTGIIPRGDEVERKIREKESRDPPARAHYLKDMRIAVELDRFPYVIEAKTISERLMEVVKL